jgi:acetyl esterase/lipase
MTDRLVRPDVRIHRPRRGRLPVHLFLHGGAPA